jgi:hypothetical protein
VLLLDLRRWLIDEYGDTPGAMILINRAVVGYQDFIRIVGGILELTPQRRDCACGRVVLRSHRRRRISC